MDWAGWNTRPLEVWKSVKYIEQRFYHITTYGSACSTLGGTEGGSAACHLAWC